LPFFVRVAIVAFDSLGSHRRRWVELVAVGHVGCIRHVRVVECWAGTAVGFDSCRFAGRVVPSLCGMCRRRWAGAKAGLLTFLISYLSLVFVKCPTHCLMRAGILGLEYSTAMQRQWGRT